MSDDDASTPGRMATRGGQRVNYAELNSSGSGIRGFDEVVDDGVFRSPSASTRGRKRRVNTNDENIEFMPPKRGRGRGGVVGVPRSGRGGRRSIATELDNKGLFGAVRTGRNLEQTVDDWVSAYENDPDRALVELQQLFISACGCKGSLNIHMTSSMEYKDIIRKMTEDFDEETCDYPLIMTGPQYKKFRGNFSDLLMLLINKCKSSIIFDNRMMDSVIQLLTGLADSQVRAFRHTSTFAAMKISSALVDVTIELANLKERNQKQVEAEKAKVKQQKATSEKLDVLVQKKAEIEEKTEDVREMLQFIFKSVFVHRYRDVLPDTRSICIIELGNWMEVYPEHFLEDSYLKYIGWTLHDKVADVRLKCILALLPLYGRSEVAYKLELFTNKFKERLVTMVMDKDMDVSIKACNLMTAIYRVFPTLLSVKECVPIYEQVYANNRSLAVAAGEFLNTKVFQTRKGGAPSQEENAKLIMDLVQFFIEGEVHDHASYLVDALIDTNPMVKEWRTMVNLLLGDQVDKMESQLIDIMCCAAKQAATGESPVGRNPVKGRGNTQVRDMRNLKEERTRLSEVFIPSLPLLLNKFIADREKIVNLMTLPIYFQLELYMTSHYEKHLKELMDVVKVILDKYSDDEILLLTAEVVGSMTTNTLTNQYTESFRIGLFDSLSLQLRTCIQQFHSDSQLDEEDEAALVSAFRRMTAIASHLDMRRFDLWDTVMSVVTGSGEGKTIPRDAMDMAIRFLCLQLSYDLSKLSREEGNRADAVRRLKKRRDALVQTLDGILTGFASCVETAFKCLCDILILFNSVLAENEQLKSLVIVPNTDLVKKMHTFVADNVFSDSHESMQLDQQQQIELMHKKRSLVAQFCKLILHGVFPMEEGAVLLTHYVKYYSDFGDILKLLLYKSRDIDRLENAKCIILSLQHAYNNVRPSAKEIVDPDSDHFGSLRELAKRFAVSLGPDHVKNRDSLAVIHRDGILYAMNSEVSKRTKAPMNLSFLEVIIEFSYKLLRQDKLAILRYLEKHSLPFHIVSEDPAWQPYVLYKNSLMDKTNDDVSSVRSFSIRGRGRGRGRGGGRATSAIRGDDLDD